MSLDNVAYEIRHEGQDLKLRHVENTSDRSQPAIEPGTHVKQWDKGGFLKEIETGVALKHVDDTQDRSSPKIEDVQVHPSGRPALLAEVKAVGGHHALVNEIKTQPMTLNHVECPADRSAPVVEGAQVKKWDKGAFLHEIEAEHKLKHVDMAADRSGPRLEPDVQIKPNKHNELLSEIESCSGKHLRHVEEADDRSEPHVTHTAAIRVAGPKP